MASQPPPDLNSILRMLGESQQRPATSTPTQPQAGPPAPVGPPMSYAQNPYGQQPQAYHQPAYNSFPQPSASGSIDLSAVRPVNTGTVQVLPHDADRNAIAADAIARAKAIAIEKGIVPYDRPVGVYPQQDLHQYQQRSRSKSPSRGRDPYRDTYRENNRDSNPYLDERRGAHAPSGRGEYGRERSLSPARGRFSPRGAAGGGVRDRSPLRGKSDTETMEIESSLVGLIIGRQGENLRKVESESSCRVQFIPPTGASDPIRYCKITGARERREEAKEMINKIIRDSGMRSGGRGGSDSGHREARPAPPPSATGSKEGDDSLQIMVPDRTVGLIIGRGGETIRDLQERSGCHINIVGENKSVNGLRPVNLIGPPAAARHAKELILEIVDSDSRNGNNPAAPAARAPRNDNFGGGGGGGGGGPGGHDKVNDSIYVPSDAVGMIIGKGGETIREMQNTTGCKINVSQSSGPGEVEREIGLVGSRDSITRAKRAIEEKVDAAKSGGGGGAGRGRGQQTGRDYETPGYGHSSSNTNSTPAQHGEAAPAGATTAADPYAMYGGYDNYVALWYQSQIQQQAQQGGAASGQAPGTS
ncbi:hypothetical protein B0H67DRAFT_385134 [Lasiosphaeris hirsuta]|uniref:K Homology domain-containing protein n=1 Tax=Lasiosphaeris hirsuta TaxID=260670 RepID=A0AA39ZXP0_9PEZI|nr:hypothetical protein B0H67DRAFT_385134 [Lasiosphaeris hirsuta]